MVDTIDIYSDFISYELAEELKKYAVIKTAAHKINEKIEILYEFTNVQYQKSYTSNIQISVLDEKWIYDEIRKIAIKVKTKPYLRIVGSVHKFFLGCNIYGGSDNIKYQVEYLLLSIESDLELVNELPKYNNWFVNRIDYAKVYNLGSQENVRQYFLTLGNVKYPRSKVRYMEGESVYKGGRSVTIKIYNKLEEFKAHDYKKWKKYNYEKGESLLDIAAGIVRCEIEIKKPKLQYDFQKSEVKLNEINKDYMDNIYKIEISKLLNEGEDMIKIKNNSQARMIIFNKLSPELARLVYGFYNDMCLNGYKEVKKSMPERTYYRYKKILKELGINYINHDIKNENAVYFNPLVNEPYDIDLIAL